MGDGFLEAFFEILEVVVSHPSPGLMSGCPRLAADGLSVRLSATVFRELPAPPAHQAASRSADHCPHATYALGGGRGSGPG